MKKKIKCITNLYIHQWNNFVNEVSLCILIGREKGETGRVHGWKTKMGMNRE